VSTAKKLFAALLAASIVAVMAAGCQRGGGQSGETGSAKAIMVKGSDTMVHLVSAWAESYMKADPNLDVSVTGGGSGTGIAALINGTADVCAASRQMSQAEIDQAGKRNVTPVESVVARDGIAVVVNPANPLGELTLEQLEKIFTGACTNWNQVGGPDEPIEVLSRESSSGTFVFFQEHVLRKKDYSPSARLMPATSSIIQSVGADKGAVGYVGLGYSNEAGDKVKVLAVKAAADAPAVAPTEATVRSGEYSIARPLYFYTNGAPSGEVKKFIDFCLGGEGQRIVRETGYITVK
jgi:phosphate transport system substrate-binding protein